MAQKGYVFKKNGAWYLRYRDNFIVAGRLVRKQVCVRLAEVSERYRRESDLTHLIEEKMANVRQASKCPGSAELFVNFVEAVYLPHIQSTKKASTYSGYSSYWKRYLKPRVRTVRASRDFTMAITSRLLADIANGGTRWNIDTVAKVRSILSGAFSTFALSDRRLSPARARPDNPCAGALLPKAQTEELKPQRPTPHKK